VVAEAGKIDADDEAHMLAYFHQASVHMVNDTGPGTPVP